MEKSMPNQPGSPWARRSFFLMFAVLCGAALLPSAYLLAEAAAPATGAWVGQPRAFGPLLTSTSTPTSTYTPTFIPTASNTPAIVPTSSPTQCFQPTPQV